MRVILRGPNVLIRLYLPPVMCHGCAVAAPTERGKTNPKNALATFLRARTGPSFFRRSRQFVDDKNWPMLVPVPRLYDSGAVALARSFRIAFFPKERMLMHSKFWEPGLLNLFHHLLCGELWFRSPPLPNILAKYFLPNPTSDRRTRLHDLLDPASLLSPL